MQVKTELGEGAMRYVAETLQISDSVNPSGRYPVMVGKFSMSAQNLIHEKLRLYNHQKDWLLLHSSHCLKKMTVWSIHIEYFIYYIV